MSQASGLAQLDYKAIAKFYGEGITPTALEFKLRGYKRLAQNLRDDASEQGDCLTSSVRTPRARVPRSTSRSGKSATLPKGKKGLEGKSYSTTEPTEQNPSPSVKTEPIIIKDESDTEDIKKEIRDDAKATFIFEDTDTDLEVIDSEIKRDNGNTRALLKIKSRVRRPTEEVPSKRHKRHHSDFPTTLPNLLAPEHSVRIDSQSNGYMLPKTASHARFPIPAVRCPTTSMTERLSLTAYAEDENSETEYSRPTRGAVHRPYAPVEEI
ncbi:hypothetical protein N7510_000252 [Penicillium lagena]|uniref:uncharacterized protein n=1 Tax=Penicillium lagena TaxID=94218 RepID=UPI002541FFE5|nr:uncharacterized protein N7510_000252 [Penicillium lagena]KAJ5623943.1 hypothetical protein N7510_000252 [Penicillium lagena]